MPPKHLQDQWNTVHDAMLAREDDTIRFRWGRSVGSVGVTVTSYNSSGAFESEKTISLEGARGLWRTLISTGWSRWA